LFWTSNDWLVFPWERTGWQRLYAIRSGGGDAKLLTPGNSEIFNVALDPSGAKLVYSSNEGDSDRLHLWEVDMMGRAPRQLTKGDRIEDLPAITGTGRVVALHGDAQFPIRPASVSDGGTLLDLAPDLIPSSFPGAKLVAPIAVSISSPDGMKVHGQLFLPPQRSGNKRPAILFFHGGPRRQMYLGWHPMDSYAYLYAMNQFLVNDGYIVLSVNFRGGIGYGLDFREAKDFGMGGASEFNDILGAVNYLKARADVDPKRIGVYGGSYGGFMTALALARASDQIAAGVDYAGVHDWKTFAAVQIPRADQKILDKAFESSPVATLDKWTSPVLFVQADDDRNVPFSQTVEVITGLRKIGKVEVEQIVMPDEIHDLLRHQSWLTLFNATREFFDRKLVNQN
jgi:dipeptidyl aminopeptidase/acylaminoacyl peptidase